MGIRLPKIQVGKIIGGVVSTLPGGGAIVAGAEKAIDLAKASGTTEAHIQDRMLKYANYPDSQLNDIIRIYGGEMGEAARRVLAQRGATVNTAGSGSLLVVGALALLVFLLIRRRGGKTL